MAAGNASRIIHAPGRLVVNPTDVVQLAYPHGGTEVGRTKAVALVSTTTPFLVECEGLGGEPSDILEQTRRMVFGCMLRGWDDDAVEKLFADNFSQGSNTGHAVMREPGNKVGGASALARAVSLLFVPDDPVHVPGFIAYRAICYWSEGAEIAWQRGTELGIPLAAECIRGATGSIAEIGRLHDLTV